MNTEKNFLATMREVIRKIPLPVSGRTALLLLVLLPVLILFGYVVLRSGPLAPIPVTVTTAESISVSPALFGVGTVEARSLFKIGPNSPGRVKRVLVNVGDRVKARQLLAEMERPDLDVLSNTDAERDFIRKALAQEELDARGRLATAENNLRDLLARVPAPAEAETREARANVALARQDLARVSGGAKNPLRSSANLRLVAPVSGLVIARSAEPGTTVVAGQSVVEVIDPTTLWINVRFDQVGSAGLKAGLGGKIVLRSRAAPTTGHVLRVEPIADAVTEETIAKVVFDASPVPLPALGELAEVTIALPALPARPTIPNAALTRLSGELGVWVVENNTHKIRFVPLKIGVADLDGNVQIHAGLNAGERVVVYSKSPLKAGSRIKIVERMTEAPR